MGLRIHAFGIRDPGIRGSGIRSFGSGIQESGIRDPTIWDPGSRDLGIQDPGPRNPGSGIWDPRIRDLESKNPGNRLGADSSIRAQTRKELVAPPQKRSLSLEILTEGILPWATPHQQKASFLESERSRKEPPRWELATQGPPSCGEGGRGSGWDPQKDSLCGVKGAVGDGPEKIRCRNKCSYSTKRTMLMLPL